MALIPNEVRPDLNAVPRHELRADDRLAIHIRSVSTLRVAQIVPVTRPLQHGMPRRDQRTRQHDIAIRRAAKRDARRIQHDGLRRLAAKQNLRPLTAPEQLRVVGHRLRRLDRLILHIKPQRRPTQHQLIAGPQRRASLNKLSVDRRPARAAEVLNARRSINRRDLCMTARDTQVVQHHRTTRLAPNDGVG